MGTSKLMIKGRMCNVFMCFRKSFFGEMGNQERERERGERKIKRLRCQRRNVLGRALKRNDLRCLLNRAK